MPDTEVWDIIEQDGTMCYSHFYYEIGTENTSQTVYPKDST